MSNVKLKPCRAVVDLCFSCPACGAENWRGSDEVNALGKIVCLSCRKVTEVEPITVKVKYGMVSKPDPSPAKIPNRDVDQFVEMLVRLGCQRPHAKRIVERAVMDNACPTADENEFIAYLLTMIRLVK